MLEAVCRSHVSFVRRNAYRLAALFLAFFIAACQKPALRSDRGDDSEEEKKEKVAKTVEDPFKEPPKPETEKPKQPPLQTMQPPKGPVETAPSLSQAEKAREIDRREKMLEAQLAGIRSLEADFARQAQPLNDLRRKLQMARSKQSAQRSGGVRVERVNGKSIFVDHAKEARRLESRIREQEQFVEPFRKSLEKARADYEELRRSLEELRRQ